MLRLIGNPNLAPEEYLDELKLTKQEKIYALRIPEYMSEKVKNGRSPKGVAAGVLLKFKYGKDGAELTALEHDLVPYLKEIHGRHAIFVANKGIREAIKAGGYIKDRRYYLKEEYLKQN
ncbi:MAG: hypothetical protein QMD14_04870 [Candidatus Aenigmarchaeota archaeon]|nr:hypothetical protein [Candidatus Aenigmarchaeota archaeon]